MISNKLFVYGTLKQGGELHPDLKRQKVRLLGPARIQGRLFQIEGESFPGAVPTNSNEYVTGELYELSEPDLALGKIDEIEGCDEGLFERRLTDAWHNGRKMKAWAYFYARPLRKSAHLADGTFPVKPGFRAAR